MKEPIYHEDDKELLGVLVDSNGSWQAQTVFGYAIARFSTRDEAETFIHEQGRGFLKGTWQYYDKDDHDWFACIIKEATEHSVTVIRTNSQGYQEPDLYKRVILKNPDENSLVKSS